MVAFWKEIAQKVIAPRYQVKYLVMLLGRPPTIHERLG